MSDVIVVTEEVEGSVIVTEYSSDGVFSTEEVGVDVLFTSSGVVTVVTPVEGVVTIVNELLQGPQGIPGVESGGFVRYPVAYAMSGHRIVVVNGVGSVIYASKNDMTHVNKVLGMTVEAVISDNILIQTSGIVVEPSWNWSLDIPIWLGVDGLMTQIVPVSGFSLIIGFPVTSDSMSIGIREPIVLV